MEHHTTTSYCGLKVLRVQVNTIWRRYYGGLKTDSLAIFQRKRAIQSCTSWSPNTQYHKCSNYCQRVKSTYITYCRFAFPRPTCESATLLSTDEGMKSSHRKVYKLPRSPEEIRVNNYNPLLLMLWKANMDIQFIGESTLAIAQYVTGYVTKAEKNKLQDMWQEVSSHQSIYSKLWSFGVRSLRSRECGLYEASDLLLGDHLCGKSKTIKWVDVSQPHNRKRRLISHSRLVERAEPKLDCHI